MTRRGAVIAALVSPMSLIGQQEEPVRTLGPYIGTPGNLDHERALLGVPRIHKVSLDHLKPGDVALEVSMAGRTVRLTAKEVMDALEPVAMNYNVPNR